MRVGEGWSAMGRGRNYRVFIMHTCFKPVKSTRKTIAVLLLVAKYIIILNPLLNHEYWGYAITQQLLLLKVQVDQPVIQTAVGRGAPSSQKNKMMLIIPLRRGA
jgi:hypothetical protein